MGAIEQRRSGKTFEAQLSATDFHAVGEAQEANIGAHARFEASTLGRLAIEGRETRKLGIGSHAGTPYIVRVILTWAAICANAKV